MMKCTAWLCCSGCVYLCMACLASVCHMLSAFLLMLGSLIVRRLVLLLAVLSIQLLDFPVPVATKFAVPHCSTLRPRCTSVTGENPSPTSVTGENPSPSFFSYLYNYGTNLCQSRTSRDIWAWETYERSPWRCSSFELPPDICCACHLKCSFGTCLVAAPCSGQLWCKFHKILERPVALPRRVCILYHSIVIDACSSFLKQHI